MTAPDSLPVVEWFSLADLAACRAPAAGPASEAPAVLTGPRSVFGQSDCFGYALADTPDRLRRAGFATLGYSAYDMIGRRVLGAYVLSAFAPASFARAYLAQGLHDADARFAELRRSGFPVAWRLDALEAEARREADPRARSLAALLRAHAMHSGVMFSLAEPRLGLRIVVNLDSPLPDADWIDDRVVGGALALSLGVHRAAQPWLDARIGARRPAALEAEQAGVLERLVRGLSDQEIADAMRMSTHRVGAQIRMLEKLFNARNRAQLAYLAARRMHG
ncbi:autoinducer binding domain-containing protein [Burkholderia sp. FERM BP-3421]|jgi:DNA-binding CsgD family transcriptional regulator|uniref:autoinducer binding domain-containing protein n=1 Tax=Burkholderia sp. FERM BP-3421 TaxID=1494466 RepID=UPI002361B2CA|nr:autoinducer binding domain-containing protein [Burkholderia sp. FERM BP-3421]WDD91749.1 autoinducer binding domain-containing protein [Burkholderia sp. FERM BP-3421]